MPWFTLAILFIGFYGRVLRSNILDTINEDFVRTAKAKGLSSRQILVKHTLRASLIPIVTLFGLDFAAVLGGGAIVTETVYTLHGVGYYAYTSIQTAGSAAADGRDALRRCLHRRLLDARRRRVRVPGSEDPAHLMAETLLEVNDLSVQFATEDGIVRAVDGISLELERGKVLGIVGESGSGKSVTAMTLMGLTRGVNARFEGEVLYKGTNLLEVSDTDMQNYRGNELGMIFQDPMTSLNPVYRIGEQIVESIRAHESVDKRTARSRTVELLRQVGIPNPETRVDNFPHEFSGGMRQRAMIAMALSCNPSILIADEPTTALDVTIQAQIVELINTLKDDFNSAVIFITHDLGVIAEIADEILVMYAGRVVESGSKRDLFYDPQMPYTWGLLGSIPRLDRPRVERLHTIEGMPPSLINPPEGCKFRPRCPHAFEKCRQEPKLENRVGTPGHLDRCWLDVEFKRAHRDETITPGSEEAA